MANRAPESLFKGCSLSLVKCRLSKKEEKIMRARIQFSTPSRHKITERNGPPDDRAPSRKYLPRILGQLKREGVYRDAADGVSVRRV